MKKLLAALLLMGCFSGLALAVKVEGFRGGITAKATVAEALKLNDDAYVTIQGNIVKQISEDKYLFKDETGSITVEIDQNKWLGQSVDVNDKLELTGEIEKNLTTTELDVNIVRKIK